MMNNVATKSDKLEEEKTDEAYDIKHVIDSVSPEISRRLRKEFGELVEEFQDVFSKNQ